MACDFWEVQNVLQLATSAIFSNCDFGWHFAIVYWTYRDTILVLGLQNGVTCFDKLYLPNG